MLFYNFPFLLIVIELDSFKNYITKDTERTLNYDLLLGKGIRSSPNGLEDIQFKVRISLKRFNDHKDVTCSIY